MRVSLDPISRGFQGLIIGAIKIAGLLAFAIYRRGFSHGSFSDLLRKIIQYPFIFPAQILIVEFREYELENFFKNIHTGICQNFIFHFKIEDYDICAFFSLPNVTEYSKVNRFLGYPYWSRSLAA